MIDEYLNHRTFSNSKEAIEKLTEAAFDTDKVEEGTHVYYRYPACFSPKLARELILSFTKPGDMVLDPFVGGGTTAVEALLHKRRITGIDLNELSLFVSRVKITPLKLQEISLLDSWVNEVSDLQNEEFTKSDLAPANVFGDTDPKLANTIAKIRNLAIAKISSQAAKRFALAVLLRTSKIAIDSRQVQPDSKTFIRSFLKNYEGMIDANSEFGIRTKPIRIAEWYKLKHGDTTNPRTFNGVESSSLIVTSPPYPGVSVLYNRWQVQGRREVTIPYWIIGCNHDRPASDFTLGYPKTEAGLKKYFNAIHQGSQNLRKVIKRRGLMVHVVAFSDRKTQLLPYLDAVRNAGFEELKGIFGSSYDGRLWRHIPNRKWYTNINSKPKSRREVVLFFAAK